MVFTICRSVLAPRSSMSAGRVRIGMVLQRVYVQCLACLDLGRDKHDCASVGQIFIQNYHQSIHRWAMLQALVRRSVSNVWAVAVVRIQRMLQTVLTAKGSFTRALRRLRGAITGSYLAARSGRLVVEDAFLLAQNGIRSFSFK